MNSYASLADDHYVTMNLSTEMDLSASRETLLHFAEQMRKRFPAMRNFYRRDTDDYILEEEKEHGAYRWCSFEPRRLSSGYVNPQSVEAALEQHRHALELSPYVLSISPLDCEALDLLVGFDFSYRGNHNQLVAEALGVCPALERLASAPGMGFIQYEPSLTVSLDEECQVQCRVSVETRTSPYHVRTGEFQEEQLSVYVNARRFGSLDAGMTFVQALDQLSTVCQDMIEHYVVESVLEPLARTIALD